MPKKRAKTVQAMRTRILTELPFFFLHATRRWLGRWGSCGRDYFPPFFLICQERGGDEIGGFVSSASDIPIPEKNIKREDCAKDSFSSLHFSSPKGLAEEEEEEEEEEEKTFLSESPQPDN